VNLMFDCAVLPAELPPGFQAVAGYWGGPAAYRTWTDDDWARTGGLKRLPIWVPAVNAAAAAAREEVLQILSLILHYDVPRGVTIAFDVETSQADQSYLEMMSQCLQHFGYGTIVYGSAFSVFTETGNLWKWPADWTGSPHMYDGPQVQATQYASSSAYDSSVISDLLLTTLW